MIDDGWADQALTSPLYTHTHTHIQGFKLAFRICCPLAYPLHIFRAGRYCGQIEVKEERDEVEYECDIDVDAAMKAAEAAGEEPTRTLKQKYISSKKSRNSTAISKDDINNLLHV